MQPIKISRERELVAGFRRLTAALELGLAMSAMLAGFGVVFLITGLGLVWAAWPERVRVPARARAPGSEPVAV